MADKITWTIANAQNFISFLEKFVKIDSNALIEFNSDGTIKSNSYTVAKSATKSGSIPIEDVFDIDDTNELTTSIKMGIYNIDKFINNIKNVLVFEPKELIFTLEYSKDKDGELYGKSFVISGDKRKKISYPCAAKTLFRWLKDDTLNNIMNTDNTEFNFTLDPETLGRITNFAAQEVGTDLTIKPILTDDGALEIQFEGRNFEGIWDLTAEKTDPRSHPTAAIKKDFLKYIDKEVYKVYSTSTSLILISTESDFKLVLAKLVDDNTD